MVLSQTIKLDNMFVIKKLQVTSRYQRREKKILLFGMIFKVVIVLTGSP